MDKKEFLYAFQISKKIIFEVDYYTLSNNPTPHFSTSADEFNQPKTDWDRCGQAQEALLPKNSIAYEFYQKWDKKHLGDLTQEEYDDLLVDIETLKDTYNYEFMDLSRMKKPYNPNIHFDKLRALSMKPLKTNWKKSKGSR